jgi:hypothetical protein
MPGVAVFSIGDEPAVSADRRFVALSSGASNLVAGDTQQHPRRVRARPREREDRTCEPEQWRQAGERVQQRGCDQR